MNSTLAKGLLLAGVQLAIVFSLSAKYAIDRERLPRVWAKAMPFDPNLPIRGRYVRLQLEVTNPPTTQPGNSIRYLATADGKLSAALDEKGTTVLWPQANATMSEPVAYFIPEHVPDPSLRAPGEELWVEVTVPRHGTPRPIRLGVKKEGGAIQPLPGL
jgi:hypothetical protein